MDYKVNDLSNITDLTPYSVRLITDMYNNTHGTSYDPKRLVFVQSGMQKITSIGQIGFGAGNFGILLYAIPGNQSICELNFGLGTNVLDNSRAGSVNSHWHNVFFDTIRQTNQYCTYCYLQFKFV
jgi:hypothetical protein